MMEFSIRPYQSDDLAALCRICLLTGDNGGDASALYQDPDLLGLYYTAPYVVFEPDLCFVLLHLNQPCGYILGTRDSTIFSARLEREWFPALRRRCPLPAADDQSHDAQIVRAFHAGRGVNDESSTYPAHLHIDLLPVAQGQGWGRHLMDMFLDRLRELAVPGVHLGVAKQNPRAIRFYEHMGFHQIEDVEQALILGKQLAPPNDSGG